MNLSSLFLAAFILLAAQTALAFHSNDEQIDYILHNVETASQTEKLKVLERLQWSTISDPRLYDSFEKNLFSFYQASDLDKDLENLLRYQIRALGYSGNIKYQSTLKTLSKDSAKSRMRSTAERALKDLPLFTKVQENLAKVSVEQGELPSETVNYIRLLKTEDSYAQRLAARAIYHENRKEAELITLIVELLKKDYQSPDLDKLKQDTLSWYCKVLNNIGGYDDLLQTVSDKSPHKKIQKHAAKK